MAQGVYFHKANKKYIAQINADGKRHYLGSFDTENQAIHRRTEAEREFSIEWAEPNTAGINQARLHYLFDYDQQSGHLIWRVKPGRKILIGDNAGHKTYQGYIAIRVDGKLYLAHRLVWLFMYGKWPLNEIDHADGNGKNNRLENLREATSSENKENNVVRKDNRLGITGVYYCNMNKKYVAHITKNQKTISLGSFNSINAAKASRAAAKTKIHLFNPTQRVS